MYVQNQPRLSDGIPHGRNAFTLIELMLCLVILAILWSILFTDRPAQTHQEIEKGIQNWKPSDHPIVQPNAEWIHPDMDIVGNWSVRRRLDSSALAIEKLDSGEYRVKFKTSGCLGGYDSERIGECRDGVLSLDKPLAEYFPGTYQKLYAVRVDESDCLLPAAFVPQFQAAVSTDPSRLNWYVYRRADESR
ncbi:MAG: prepilin-type N-terminal cleavage/methylation domain-containing protein [Planctomycetaceae bacterium]|nr:prepilin-type N-terminal cleavage/methylation domain-containing protein [Planctomycetaceae bacterium]